MFPIARVASRVDLRCESHSFREEAGVNTLDRVMAERGNASGFDYLRVLLAIGVLCIHSFSTSYGQPGEAFLFSLPWRPFSAAVLPMFFALSGFLVAGSYFRTKSIGQFVMLRVLRIAPALAVEVFLCALVLGSIFTTLPLTKYFSHPTFWSYFGNLIGWIHFLLPGVFEDNPLNIAVNLSLWTVPYELECYIALVALALLGLLSSRITFVWLLVFLHVALFASAFFRGTPPAIDGPLPHRLLVLSFLSGVLIFLYRDKIVIAPWLTVLSALVMLVVLNFPVSAQFYPPVVAYTTVALGMSNPRRTFLINTGDYSYGIYLYAFPIQQTYAHLASRPEWWWNIVFALPVTICFAAFSWHCVEKHVLKLKKLVFRSEKRGPRQATIAAMKVTGAE